MSTPFRSMPTFEQVVEQVKKLASHFGMEVRRVEHDIQQNNAITDQAIEEINLKLAFLMTQIAVKRPLNGGLAGPDGKVPYEIKPAIQVYMESGRQKMIDQREEFLRAQGLSATEAPAGSDGPTAEGADTPDDEPTTITH